MFEHIVEQQQPIHAALLELKKAELILNALEVATMQLVMSVLKPVVQIAEAIGGEKDVTVSAIRPLLCKLMKKPLVEDAADGSLENNKMSSVR
jgi:predicted transcriptional regulator